PYSSLNPRRTVAAQLLDGAGSPAGSKPGARKQQVSRLLARVGLEEDAAGRYPHEFSGGQRQRIAIARALAAEPALIIADEPVTALDASSQAQVVKLLTGLVAELGMGMVFISHDLALVRAVADEIAVMYLGTIVERAPTDQLWGSPQHPYTRALIDAVPDIDADGGLPAVLSGEVPDPARPPAGCRFRPRCPHAMDKCWKDPPLFELGGRTAACWLADPDQAAMPPTAARE
ncbi:MAG: ABC transporter ATP-binding protein, partial [Nocardioidaceae bacterium]